MMQLGPRLATIGRTLLERPESDYETDPNSGEARFVTKEHMYENSILLHCQI